MSENEINEVEIRSGDIFEYKKEHYQVFSYTYSSKSKERILSLKTQKSTIDIVNAILFDVTLFPESTFFKLLIKGEIKKVATDDPIYHDSGFHDLELKH